MTGWWVLAGVLCAVAVPGVVLALLSDRTVPLDEDQAPADRPGDDTQFDDWPAVRVPERRCPRCGGPVELADQPSMCVAVSLCVACIEAGGA